MRSGKPSSRCPDESGLFYTVRLLTNPPLHSSFPFSHLSSFLFPFSISIFIYLLFTSEGSLLDYYFALLPPRPLSASNSCTALCIQEEMDFIILGVYIRHLLTLSFQDLTVFGFKKQHFSLFLSNLKIGNGKLRESWEHAMGWFISERYGITSQKYVYIFLYQERYFDLSPNKSLMI